MFKDLYKNLNQEQRLAVDEIYGPVLVLAGPGTGKTQVVALRIANILVKTDIAPNNILCLTFTNVGVKAMRERLAGIIGPDAYKVNIHTFHSFCGELINYYPERFLFARRIIQSSDLEEMALLKKIIEEEKWEKLKPVKSPDYYLTDIHTAIGRLKLEGIGPAELEKIVDVAGADLADNETYYRKGKLMAKYQPLANLIEKNRELAAIYRIYQDRMKESGRYDYNDMIDFVLAELKRDKNWLANWQEKYQFLLVDEYQDTNGAQNELIELMGKDIEQPNIFVVGDDDQSIYRFQGANKENLLYFNSLYPDCKKIVLGTNYRSTETIVAASSSLIGQSRERITDDLGLEKTFRAAKNGGEKVAWAMFKNGEEERFFISSEIKKLIDGGVNPSEVAIFYRGHWEAEEMIDVLKKGGVVAQRHGGENVLKNILIEQIHQLMNLMDNFHDNVLWYRVMNFSWWGIETAEIMQVVVDYRRTGGSFYRWLKQKDDLAEPVKRMVAVVEELVKNSANMSMAGLFDDILIRTGLMDWLLKCNNLDGMATVKSFFDWLKNTVRQRPNMNLAELLADWQVLTEYSIKIEKNDYEILSGINLMTAHASKGLEFDYVFIYRAIDGNWNNKRQPGRLKILPNVLHQTVSQDQLEEERRLFYVAMTRAKTKIYITGAVNYFEGEDKDKSPTVFIEEIDAQWREEISKKNYSSETADWIKINTQKNIQEVDGKEKEILSRLVADFSLSPTALNNYLECPRKFLYDNLLKVPSAQENNALFGTAVHEALENFYTVFRHRRILPDESEFLAEYETALKKVGMIDADFQRFLQKGRQDLAGYYKNYAPKMVMPLFNEYDFGYGRVRLDGIIPLSGKVDRVDGLDGGRLVRVVDYKTAKPQSRRTVMGETKGSRENYWNQLVFYQLLGDLSDKFSYQIAETQIDFIEPNKRGKYIKHSFNILKSDVNKLKEVIREVWDKITRLEFGPTEDGTICGGGFVGRPCSYNSSCHNL